MDQSFFLSSYLKKIYELNESNKLERYISKVEELNRNNFFKISDEISKGLYLKEFLYEGMIYKLLFSNYVFIGFVTFIVEPDKIILESLKVRSEFSGSGFGKNLIDVIKEIGLKNRNIERIIVQIDETYNPKKFYRNQGFVTSGNYGEFIFNR